MTARAEALQVAVERIFARTEVAANGCRLVTGALNHSGYAVARIPHHGNTTAHRAVYEWANGGPLPAGTQVDHLCHTRQVATCQDGRTCLHRRCVEPTHLELVSHAENQRRGMRAQMTECLNGHPFSDENTWVRSDGRRHCRVCHRDRMRAHRVRAAAKVD